jgi:hypothetical protein
LFVGYLSDQSVIEEKGEGFENGKNILARLDLPSTSITLHYTSQDLRYYTHISIMHYK